MAGSFEGAHKHRSPIDLKRLDWKGQAGDQLSEKGGRGPGDSLATNPDHGHARDDIDHRELEALDSWQRAYLHRIDLDQGPGGGRLPLVLRHPGRIGSQQPGLMNTHGGTPT